MPDTKIEQPANLMGLFRATINLEAAGAPDENDLVLINRLARTPLSADEVYTFPCVPSTDALDSYFTRMALSSLQNYARDAGIGVAVMNSHRTSPWTGMGVELPVGRSYYGELQNTGDSTQLFAKAYMLRNYQPNSNTGNTDTLIRGMEAGMIFDLSIGFKPGWYRCGICQRDLFSADCPHFPGRKYGTPDGGDVTAFAWVEDAHMSEFSFVYDGATPGAGILKAQRAVEAGTLDRKAIVELEDVYQVRLASRFAVPDLAKVPGNTPEIGGDIVKDFWDRLAAVYEQRAGAKHSAATKTALEEIRKKAAEGRGSHDEVAQMVADLLAEAQTEETGGDDEGRAQRIVELEAEVARLKPLAELGAQYRADLVEDAIKAGVRAIGNDFKVDQYRKVFEGASIDDIKTFRADWERVAAAKFGPGGRQTSAEPLPGKGAPAPQRNINQYK